MEVNAEDLLSVLQYFTKTEANDYTVPFVVAVILLTLDGWLTASGNTLYCNTLHSFCMSVWSYFGHAMRLYQLGGNQELCGTYKFRY